MVYISHSEAETEAIAADLAKRLQPGSLIALAGDLGAGKTVFARGIARGLGITGRIQSPTFTLMRVYEGRIPLYHFDVYRIEDAAELDELGFHEYAAGDGICIVEWADRIASQLPEDRLNVQITGSADGERRIEVRP